MATLSQNVKQATSDFDDIKSAIIEQGVEVPDGTPTSEYGNKIRQIEGGSAPANLDDFIAGRMQEVTTQLEIIPDFAFSGKSNLHVVHAENATFIGKYAFSSAAGTSSSSSSSSESGDGGDEEPVGFTNKYLTHVYMPNVTTIDIGAFQGDESLEISELPENLAIIQEVAFNGCSHMHISDLPENVIYVGRNALATGNTFSLARFPQYLERLEFQSDVIDFANVDWATLPATAKYVALPSLPLVAQSLRNFLTQYTHNIVESGETWQILDVSNIPPQWFSVDFENFNNIFSTYYLSGAVEIPESVVSLRRSIFENMRLGPASVDLTVPNSVEFIGEKAFYRFHGLSTLTLNANITSILYRMCYNCENLTVVILPDQVHTIGPDAFDHCQGLTTVQLPANLQTISSSAFGNCTSLDVPEFPSTLVRIDSYAFAYAGQASSITGTLVIPDSVATIGEYAFYHAFDYIDKLIIGSGLPFVDQYAFTYFGASSSYLRIVIGPNTIQIGYDAFSYTDAKRVYIPISVTTIQDFAFAGCPSIEVYYQGDESQWNSMIISSQSGLANATVHYNASPEDIDVDIPTISA